MQVLIISFVIIIIGMMPSAGRIAYAQSITCDGASLRAAILAANTNGGAGGGVITLPANCTILLADAPYDGPSPVGLPPITGTVIINGNASSIERSATATDFRLFWVSPGGRLTLNNLTLRNGLARGGNGGVHYNSGHGMGGGGMGADAIYGSSWGGGLNGGNFDHPNGGFGGGGGGYCDTSIYYTANPGGNGGFGGGGGGGAGSSLCYPTGAPGGLGGFGGGRGGDGVGGVPLPNLHGHEGAGGGGFGGAVFIQFDGMFRAQSIHFENNQAVGGNGFINWDNRGSGAGSG
jgi:hypothetical protein